MSSIVYLKIWNTRSIHWPNFWPESWNSFTSFSSISLSGYVSISWTIQLELTFELFSSQILHSTYLANSYESRYHFSLQFIHVNCFQISRFKSTSPHLFASFLSSFPNCTHFIIYSIRIFPKLCLYHPVSLLPSLHFAIFFIVLLVPFFRKRPDYFFEDLLQERLCSSAFLWTS